MSSPRMGVVRDSMLINPRLIKAPLGRTRTRGLSGPGPGFSYGNSSDSRDGGVAEVLSSWRVQRHEASASPVPPDFVSLNRDAVRSGLVMSKEMSQYRAHRGGARRPQPSPKPQRGRSPPVPNITFGVTTRPSSPLSDLLAHRYGQRWLDQQLSRSQTVDHRQQQKVKAGRSPDTRTSLLRRSTVLPVTKTPFNQSLVSQVPPALDTFRDPEARRRALRIPPSGSGTIQSGPKEETP